MTTALESDTYNPSRAPDVTELYNLMNQGEPDEVLLEEERETFRAMPTANPYLGVLGNPRACEIDQVNSGIDETIESIKEQLNEVIKNEQPTVVEEWKNEYPEIIAELEHAKEIMEEYRGHTDRLISNFPTITSIVQSEIGNQVGAMGSNPCAGFGDIMGSVLQEGQDIIAEILAAVAGVAENVQPVLDLLEQAITKLKAEIAKAMTKIQEETDRIAKSMLQMKQMNLAQMLKFQMQDPCLNSILGGMMSGAAAKIVNGG